MKHSAPPTLNNNSSCHVNFQVCQLVLWLAILSTIASFKWILQNSDYELYIEVTKTFEKNSTGQSRETGNSGYKTQNKDKQNEKDEQSSKYVVMDESARERKACRISKTFVVLLKVKSDR